MTELRAPAVDTRSLLRLWFTLTAVAAILAGLSSTNDFISRVFAPDGEITELFYVHVLRAGLVIGGTALMLAAARAPLVLLQKALLLALAVIVTLAGVEVML